MRYQDIATDDPRHPARIPERIESKLGKKSGWPDEARRAATPHVVDVIGLNRNNLTAPGDFEYEFHRRRKWAADRGNHEIEPIGPNPEQLIGRRFRFSDPELAREFEAEFPTDLR